VQICSRKSIFFWRVRARSQLERKADEVGAACFQPEMISCREQRGQSCGMLLVCVVSPPKICE
jgi:hypothetical protein